MRKAAPARGGGGGVPRRADDPAAATEAAAAAAAEATLNRARARCVEVCARFPCGSAGDAPVSYGTAGFRCDATESPARLEAALVRAALLACVRSKAYGVHTPVGLMITASHNPPADNGCKLVERDGCMLGAEWERVAGTVCNERDGARVWEMLLDAWRSLGQHGTATTAPEADTDTMMMRREWTLVVGRDTRRSGRRLEEACCAAVCAVFGHDGDGDAAGDAGDCPHIRRMGVATTPMLHYEVYRLSRALRRPSEERPKDIADSEAGASRGQPQPLDEQEDYFNRIAGGYGRLIADNGLWTKDGAVDVWVDCAHGVGAIAVERLTQLIDPTVLRLRLRNAARAIEHDAQGNASEYDDSLLNVCCGSDYVQKEMRAPRGFFETGGDAREGPSTSTSAMHSMHCSLDGDADRIVFFDGAQHESGKRGARVGSTPAGGFVVFDGDRIAILAASLLKEMLAPLGRIFDASGWTPKIGIVQTAYANGASTRYIRDVLRLPTVKTKTGVKHLHRAALTFDIAVYFEANGHGSILFGDDAVSRLELLLSGIDAGRYAARDGPEGGCDVGKCRRAVSNLLHLNRMINPAVGDAVSGLLLVDVALRMRSWAMNDWFGLYADLPARQVKAIVPDRRAIVVDDATEEKVLRPLGLQDSIDECVAEVARQCEREADERESRAGLDGSSAFRTSIRCFARPSGTEDVVRVYAESAAADATDRLCGAVKGCVESFFSGAQSSRR